MEYARSALSRHYFDKRSDTKIVQGSYAGGRAAHMRILYPDLVHGAIASSGPLLLFRKGDDLT